MTRTLSLVFALSISVYACSDGNGNTGPLTPESAREPCTTLCEKDEMCSPGGESVADCITECAATFDGWAREDAMNDFAACYGAAACAEEGAGDACLLEVSVLAEHRAWQTRCTEQLATCEGVDANDCNVESGTSDDTLVFRIIAPAIMEEMTACLDGADCATRFACLDGVFTKYGIDL